MRSIFRTLSLVCVAGCVGGVLNSLVVWNFGNLGVSAALGVKIAPQLTPAWLYPRIVWGGIWGFLFLLPILRRSVISRGLLYSLGPSLVMFFIVFPMKANKGMFGLALGDMTPVLVLFFNAIWGVAASLWLRMSK
ncbi:MAG: hypothetical protein DRG34_04985 [Deltaproteobacteria bacterium]|nr:MAG: hypothetical protein DRG34_04985 [Deltaproteobacteria bacterium]